MSKLLLFRTEKFSVIGTEDDIGKLFPTKRERKERIFLDINEPYTRRMIQSALQKRSIPTVLGPGHGTEAVPMPSTCTFQWSEYERIDWSSVLAGKHKASSYCIRKGLSRKAQLAYFTHLHVCKNPGSILKDAIPQTIILDTWPVWEDSSCHVAKEGWADIVIGSASASNVNIKQRQVLELCLQEAKKALAKAEEEYENNDKLPPPVWILKPSTTNKGGWDSDSALFRTTYWDICWSESDIREWVLQRYISPPLLLRRRKFHIRAYALAVSAIRVYLSRDCLALCSGHRYNAASTSDTLAHITNTVHQQVDPNFCERDCILQWNDVDTMADLLVRDKTCRNVQEAREKVEHVICAMQRITAELFLAYKNEFGVFAPIEGCFEHYGLDFMVVKDWNVYLLEVNPGPDFKQTGDRLCRIIENLMLDTIDAAMILPRSGGTNNSTKRYGNLVCVYEHQMQGGSKSTSIDSAISMKIT